MKSLHSEIVIARYRLSYRIFHRSLVSKLFLAIFLKQFCLLWSRFSISLAKFESSWTLTLVKALNCEFRSISKWTSSVKIFYYFSDHGVCSNRSTVAVSLCSMKSGRHCKRLMVSFHYSNFVGQIFYNQQKPWIWNPYKIMFHQIQCLIHSLSQAQTLHVVKFVHK